MRANARREPEGRAAGRPRAARVRGGPDRLSLVGIDVTVLGVSSRRAVGVGLGFGLQKIASNYVSGFIILLDALAAARRRASAACRASSASARAGRAPSAGNRR